MEPGLLARRQLHLRLGLEERGPAPPLPHIWVTGLREERTGGSVWSAP